MGRIGASLQLLLASEHSECRAIFLDEHLQRLNNTLKELKISNKYLAKKEVENFLEKNFSKEKENQVLKIIISEKNKIFLERAYNYKKEDYEKGFNLNIAKTLRSEKSIFTFHKTLNYGDNILEKRKSRDLGFDEPLFLNSKNQITEGATSNIFFVKNKKIYTPIVSLGLLNGIIRQYIISKTDLEIEEKEIYLEDLREYDEVFLSNSLFGIMPANKIENYNFKNREISKMIFEKYKKEILDN